MAGLFNESPDHGNPQGSRWLLVMWLLAFSTTGSDYGVKSALSFCEQLSSPMLMGTSSRPLLFYYRRELSWRWGMNIVSLDLPSTGALAGNFTINHSRHLAGQIRQLEKMWIGRDVAGAD